MPHYVSIAGHRHSTADTCLHCRPPPLKFAVGNHRTLPLGNRINHVSHRTPPLGNRLNHVNAPPLAFAIGTHVHRPNQTDPSPHQALQHVWAAVAAPASDDSMGAATREGLAGGVSGSGAGFGGDACFGLEGLSSLQSTLETDTDTVTTTAMRTNTTDSTTCTSTSTNTNTGAGNTYAGTGNTNTGTCTGTDTGTDAGTNTDAHTNTGTGTGTNIGTGTTDVPTTAETPLQRRKRDAENAAIDQRLLRLLPQGILQAPKADYQAFMYMCAGDHGRNRSTNCVPPGYSYDRYQRSRKQLGLGDYHLSPQETKRLRLMRKRELGRMSRARSVAVNAAQRQVRWFPWIPCL